MLNLDTHMILHALRGDLKPEERTLLVENSWGIASICLWELAKLRQLGRIDMDLNDPEIQSVLSTVHVWPLNMDVALMSTRLDFRGDPADELIAATSIVHGVPLVTRDAQILSSRMVPFPD